MQASNVPSKSAVPFADSGTKNTIPVASQIGVTPGAASFTDGFPPLTMTPLAAGGVPPYGADFNGILNFLSAGLRWSQAGGCYSFDVGFSAAVGGYPRGAILKAAAADAFWVSLVDNNTANPDAGPSANWTGIALINSPQFTGTPTAPTPSAGDSSTRLATTAFVAGNFPRVYSINSLPTQNVGPITVAECGEVWIWSSSAYFTGYRSPLCGRPVDGHTLSPLVSEVDATGGDLNKAAYPGLWGYAQENGLVISDSSWIANRGAHFFVDTGPSTFRVPDLRNIFRRYTGINADTGGTRTFGSLMKEAMKDHLHAPSGGSQFAMLSSGGGAGFAGSGYTVNGVGQTGGIQGGGGSETRPINTAYYPRIHI